MATSTSWGRIEARPGRVRADLFPTALPPQTLCAVRRYRSSRTNRVDARRIALEAGNLRTNAGCEFTNEPASDAAVPGAVDSLACSQCSRSASPSVRIAPMQGRSRPDRQLLDASAFCRGLVEDGTVSAFFSDHRDELLKEADTADLFPSSRGRPPIPAVLICSVLVQQALDGLPDRRCRRRRRRRRPRRPERQELRATSRQHRPMAERAISRLVAKGNRRRRDRGVERNEAWAHRRVAPHNLPKLVVLGLRRKNRNSVLATTSWALGSVLRRARHLLAQGQIQRDRIFPLNSGSSVQAYPQGPDEQDTPGRARWEGRGSTAAHQRVRGHETRTPAYRGGTPPLGEKQARPRLVSCRPRDPVPKDCGAPVLQHASPASSTFVSAKSQPVRAHRPKRAGPRGAHQRCATGPRRESGRPG